MTAPAETSKTTRFAELAQMTLAEAPSGSLPAIRQRAAERFAALGLPTARQEDWRFSDVSPLSRAEYALPTTPDAELARGAVEPILFPLPGGAVFVFLDGRLHEPLSKIDGLPAGVTMQPLAEAGEEAVSRLGRLADAEGHPFVALNTAGWREGALLTVPDGVTVESPLHFVFLSSTGAATLVSQPRLLLQIGRNAQLTLVESYGSIGEDKALTNAVTEIWLEENATLDHYRIQREGGGSFHLGTLAVRQARSSTLRSFAFSAGARFNRTEIRTVFDGEGASCTLNGLYFARRRQLVDHQTSIDHATPHGTSRELYKGILDERARAVFNGEIVVRPDAQKSNAQQTNKNLILSDETTVNSKPQLEIFANDVLCAHGATVGQLDADSLYYMRARGISADRAARLLTYAFAAELIDEVRVPGLRDLLFQNLFSDLPNAEELREHS